MLTSIPPGTYRIIPCNGYPLCVSSASIHQPFLFWLYLPTYAGASSNGVFTMPGQYFSSCFSPHALNTRRSTIASYTERCGRVVGNVDSVYPTTVPRIGYHETITAFVVWNLIYLELLVLVVLLMIFALLSPACCFFFLPCQYVLPMIMLFTGLNMDVVNFVQDVYRIIAK